MIRKGTICSFDMTVLFIEVGDEFYSSPPRQDGRGRQMTVLADHRAFGDNQLHES